jgi:hypothetical protein
MLVDRVEGCTRVLGAPKGWTPETSGDCHGLPIRDEMNGDVPCMISAWEPTPAELAALNLGAKVMLRLVGTGHPPVALYVSDVPDASAGEAGTAAIAKTSAVHEHATGAAGDAQTPSVSPLTSKENES